MCGGQLRLRGTHGGFCLRPLAVELGSGKTDEELALPDARAAIHGHGLHKPGDLGIDIYGFIGNQLRRQADGRL